MTGQPPLVDNERVSLSVVIPAHNEEEILEQTVERVLSGLEDLTALSRYEVLVCENGSTDATRAIAGELAARHPRVKLLLSPVADYGAAMKAGFLTADGDVIVNFDADYYDLDFVRAALEVDADIVVAAKGIVGSQDARVLVRRVVSRCFGWFVRLLLAVKVTETHGIKLFRRTSIDHLLPQIECTKDLFDTELLARAEWTGLRIKELPIRTQEMRHSRSGILRRIPRTMWGLVRLRYRLRRFRHPSLLASRERVETRTP